MHTHISFIPNGEQAEIMYVTVQNISNTMQNLKPYAAVPIYGRSADNIRDHRNVTSMLHRIRTDRHGVFVCPTMSFDEKGHRPNSRIYYVMGCTGAGSAPAAFYPTVEAFLGEGYKVSSRTSQDYTEKPCLETTNKQTKPTKTKRKEYIHGILRYMDASGGYHPE